MDQIAVGILCGGKSSRMGSNKAKLLIEGDTFLERLCRKMSSFEEVVVSIDSKEKYPELTLRYVEDENQKIGPIEGIRRILSDIHSDYVFICAADMPYVTRETVEKLARFITPEYDCYAVKDSGGVHPLCGIYAKATLQVAETQIKNRNFKLLLFLEACNTRYITLEEAGISPQVLQNINTPEEYRKLKDVT